MLASPGVLEEVAHQKRATTNLQQKPSMLQHQQRFKPDSCVAHSLIDCGGLGCRLP